MKIGILQTGHAPDELRPDTGDYSDIFQSMLAGHGFQFDVYNVVDMEFPAEAGAADGWLITGSRHGAYEDLPWIALLEQLIRDVHARNAPLVGICFGHQIIAQALGGKVEKFAGGWAIGRIEYQMNGAPIALHAWHQDQVTELPPGATVLAGNAFCENAIVSYGDTIWTIQPHPEYEQDFIDGLIRTRGPGVVPDDQLAHASANLGAPVDNAEMAKHMVAVFKKARA
jgi:GMP synthase (glutamine-hydrolysing)